MLLKPLGTSQEDRLRAGVLDFEGWKLRVPTKVSGHKLRLYRSIATVTSQGSGQ